MCGPMEVMSLGKQCYFCVLVDDKTGYLWFHPCMSKSDFAPWFIKLDTLFMNHYHTRTKTLRSDHGGEYVNSILQKYCKEIGISMEFTIPHTPEQNGVAERANRRIVDKGHTIMKDTNAPAFLRPTPFPTSISPTPRWLQVALAALDHQPSLPLGPTLPALHESIVPRVAWNHLTMVPMGGERKPS